MLDFKLLKKDIADLMKTSVPLIGSMLSGLIMMVVDRICLSQYSEETLAASGPAIYTAITIITFFVALAGITRVFIGQANGKKDDYNIAVAAFSGISISVILGIIFILLRPLMILIPELSSRPAAIKILEQQFLGIASFYGFFMILNSSFGAILNGILKTKVTMFMGILGNVLNGAFTILFVFGYLGFPELGMRGSAYGTLVASATTTAVYAIILLQSTIFKPLKEQSIQFKALLQFSLKMIKVGIPSGAAQTLDEAAQTAFVWILGGIGLAGLMANNVALSINYIIIIPLIGLGIGTNILIANKVGSGDGKAVSGIIKAAFCIALCYILPMTILEFLFAPKLIVPFITKDVDAQIFNLSVSTVKVLFTYAIGFAVSMIMSGALEAVGMTKHVFWSRFTITWLINLPIIFLLAKFNKDNPNIVQLCWAVFSAFEFIIGLVYGILFYRKGHKQKLLID